MDFETLIRQIVIVALPVLVAYVGVLIRAGNKAAKAAVDIEQADKYIDWISTAIKDIVQAIAQTIVDQLKKEGAFTKERQQEVLDLAKKDIEAIITPSGRKILAEVYGDIDTWLLSKIEAEVRKSKAPEMIIIE